MVKPLGRDIFMQTVSTMASVSGVLEKPRLASKNWVKHNKWNDGTEMDYDDEKRLVSKHRKGIEKEPKTYNGQKGGRKNWGRIV